MNMPKVSVAVAIYNSEKYLRQCVDSLVNQTLDDIEIILVSDASLDNSASIMQEYFEKYPSKIKMCILPENKHLGGARQAGLSLACGEYFGYVDGDDYVDEDMYKTLYGFAKTNDLDCSESYYWNFDDEIGTKVVREFSGGFSRIVRRDLIIKNNVTFIDNLYADEYYWDLILCYVRNRGMLEKPLYYAREQALSIRHTISSMTIGDRLEIKKILLDELLSRKIEQRPFSPEIEGRTIRFHCLSTYYLFALSKKVDFMLIKYYVKSSKDLLKNYFPDYKANKEFYSKIPITEKALLWTIHKATAIAYVLTFLSSTVLNWLRKLKRYFQGGYSYKGGK